MDKTSRSHKLHQRMTFYKHLTFFNNKHKVASPFFDIFSFPFTYLQYVFMDLVLNKFIFNQMFRKELI